MRVRAVAMGAALVAILTAVAVLLWTASPRPPRSILLISVDTTRADALGAYGGTGGRPASTAWRAREWSSSARWPRRPRPGPPLRRSTPPPTWWSTMCCTVPARFPRTGAPWRSTSASAACAPRPSSAAASSPAATGSQRASSTTTRTSNRRTAAGDRARRRQHGLARDRMAREPRRGGGFLLLGCTSSTRTLPSRLALAPI